jgi:hypothetical protein
VPDKRIKEPADTVEMVIIHLEKGPDVEKQRHERHPQNVGTREQRDISIPPLLHLSQKLGFQS